MGQGAPAHRRAPRRGRRPDPGPALQPQVIAVHTTIEPPLRVAGLVEAEGRVAKRTTIRIVIASCVWALATILLAVGLFAVAAAIYIALADVMHPAAALLVVALFV